MANEVLTQNKKVLTPQTKALMFAKSTRQNIQILPSASMQEGGSVSFEVPKTRLLSRVYIKIKGTFKATHASVTTLTPTRFAPWGLIKQIREQINNGFNPYQVSGKGVYLYNSLDVNNVLASITTLGSTASSSGASNTLDILVDVTNALNDRDPVGLILSQNQETVVNIGIDFNSVADLFTDSALTISDVSVQVTPIVESYSIPASVDAIPDLSVLKLVNEQNYTIGASGSIYYVKLPVGLTYRKILLNFEASGVAFTDSEIGNLTIMFNQADQPINIPADVLRKLNTKMYGTALPAGVLVFDFSYQGIPNYGGSRDYIDTERLTEFWIGLTPQKTGTIQVVSETLAKLAGS